MAFFLHQKENCTEITEKLFAQLNVDLTYTTLEKNLYEHPDYPSLVSISDVLNYYGVENISIKTSADKLSKLPMPSIAHIKNDSGLADVFTVISWIKGNTINYYHQEKHSWETISINDFDKKWPSGILLLADAEGARGESEFSQKRREEKRLKLAEYATWLTFPLLAFFACLSEFVQFGAIVVLPIFFLLLTLAGSIVCVLLVWYEIDQYNPVLQQICTAGKKLNCGAILNSKASKIGDISWSAIGLSYFLGSLFTLLIFGISNTLGLYILSWINLFAVPYVFFSIYYQWRVAKQWCVLCLGVQTVLILQLFVAFFGNWHTIIPLSTVINVNILLHILLAFITPILSIILLLPTYRTAKESRGIKTELQRLKHNPKIFEPLLIKQKEVTTSPEGLGIILGNPNASYKIIKVCNPYCGPCSKAHKPMEELLNNNPNLQIQIIFTATNNESDTSAKPAKHLLAIAEKGDEILTKRALDNWYLTEEKDYERFTAKYPMNGELKHQDIKVEEMKEWCDKIKIDFTPTFFISIPSLEFGQPTKFHQLPEMYSVADLKYLLSV